MNELPEKRKEFAGALLDNVKTIESVLPQGMDVKRFCRMAINAIIRNPALANADKNTFVMSVINCAEMGLEPALGQAALVPYKGKVQCLPMYQGMIELARRSGQISTIYAEVVYEKEDFEYELGLHPILKHIPRPDRGGEIKYVYAVAHLKDGGEQFVVLTKKDIDKVKAISPSARNSESPWQKWPEEQWKKTALKRLCKILPKSTQLQRAVELDNLANAGKVQAPATADLDTSTLDLDAVTGEDTDAGLKKPEPKKPGKSSKPKEPKSPSDGPKDTVDTEEAGEDAEPSEPFDRDTVLAEVISFCNTKPKGGIRRAKKRVNLAEDDAPDILDDDGLLAFRNMLKAL